MKTKPRIIDGGDVGAAVAQHWEELCSNGDLTINAGNGVAGGIRLIDGRPAWWAHDNNGQAIEPVERNRRCGSYEVAYNWLRGQKPAFVRNFGPPPAPQRDGFFTEQPQHPLSIMSRPWLGLVLADGQRVGCVANGFPIVADGHMLALIARFGDGSIEYPWLEQHLSEGAIMLTLELARALGSSFAIAFNPPFFGATQAQFHVHILKRGSYLVERAVRIQLHGGGAFPMYPAGCLILEDASAAVLRFWLERLAEHGISANLLVRERTAFVFPRRPGVGVLPEFPAALIAFSELAGHWITSDEKIFEALDEESLRTAVRKATLPVDEVWPILVR